MSNYVDLVTEDVKQTLEDAGCQPILFIGTGLSRRYFNAPSWVELLEKLSEICPSIDRPLAYYQQRHNNQLIEIGQEFSTLFQEWAWSSGREEFPKELFQTNQRSDIYIKYITSNIINNITPSTLTDIQSESLQEELKSLISIQPHAIITTNYDQFLESLFPDFQPIIGQSILKGEYAAIGEIFKIHGCVSSPESLILNKTDFEDFGRKKKYISAKLLTYLSEHPVLFAGYSVSDPNICSILADIDEILSPDGALISNIYFLERNEHFSPDQRYASEKLIQVAEHRSIRVKSITASDFKWVFDAFALKGNLDKVNVKLLRALLARTYELIRVDIPQQRVQVDYSALNSTLQDASGLPKLLGITPLEGSGNINATHPYTLTNVGQELGYSTWHKANELIDEILNKTGKNIKASDNRYHCKVRYGKSEQRIYSNEFIELLKKVKNEEPYQDELNDIV